MRLTNIIREQIIENAMKGSEVGKALASVTEEEDAMIEEFRKAALRHPEATLLKLEKRINKILAPFLDSPVVNRYRLIRDSLWYFTFFEGGQTENVSKVLKDENGDSLICCYTPTLPEGDYRTRWEKLSAKMKRAKQDYAAVQREVHSIVFAAKSIKQLLESWPESKELIPKPETPKGNSLAIRFEDLNKKLGIPTEEPKPVAKKNASPRSKKVA